MESCARFHRLRNFGGRLDRFPCVCTHWREKKLLPPSLFLVPRLCIGSSAHLAPSQGQQMGVFIPRVVGVRQLACGEIGPWWETEPLITMGSGCACSDTSPPGDGGLSGTAGIEPAPLTPCIPPYIKPSTWDGTQQVPHASHPSALRNARSRSWELPPDVYLLRSV